MTDKTSRLAGRKIWIVTLESLIPEETLKTAFNTGARADFIKIFPRPAFSASVTDAVNSGRVVVIASAIETSEPGAKAERMGEAIKRLCFLPPAAQKIVSENMLSGNIATIEVRLQQDPANTALICTDIALLDKAHALGAATAWIDIEGKGKLPENSPHLHIKIADWLLFFMSRSLLPPKHPKPPAPGV